MYQGSAKSIFLKVAVPQMISLLFNSIYWLVDGVFIGVRLGSLALAAAGVATPAAEMMIAVSSAVSAGACVVVSARLAKKDDAGAVSAFNTCVKTQGLIVVLIVVMGNVFLDDLVRLLGATPDIHDMTATYLRVILSFSPMLLFSYLLGGLVRSDGQPTLAMVAMTVGSLSNIVLDYVLMYPLNMGIAGAALASGIGPGVTVLMLLPHFLLKRGVLRFARVRFSLPDAGRFLRLGIPSFVMEFSIGMVTFLMNSGIVRWGYGEKGLAAYVIIGYLMLMVLTLFLGMTEGLQPAISYLNAAGERRKLGELIRFSVMVFVVVGILAYGLVWFFSIDFYHIFTPGAEDVAVFAAEQSRRYFSGFVFAGLNILAITFFQATARTGKSLTLSILRGFALPALFILTLPTMFGAEALWVCHSVAEAVTFVVAVVFVWRRFGEGGLMMNDYE